MLTIAGKRLELSRFLRPSPFAKRVFAVLVAVLHAVLLGFVFSMVFGHAPIILPAVLCVAVPYSAYFYAPLVLLHGSLFIRLIGDWMSFPEWRAWGGALNGLALLAFVLGTVSAVIRGAFMSSSKALRDV